MSKETEQKEKPRTQAVETTNVLESAPTPAPYPDSSVPKTPCEKIGALVLEEYGHLSTQEEDIGRLADVYRTVLPVLVKKGYVTLDSRGKVALVIKEDGLSLAIANAMKDSIRVNGKETSPNLQYISPPDNSNGATPDTTSYHPNCAKAEPSTQTFPIYTPVDIHSGNSPPRTEVRSPITEKDPSRIEQQPPNYVSIHPLAFNRIVRDAYYHATCKVQEGFKNSRDARRKVLEILMKEKAVIRSRTGQVTHVLPDIEERIYAILPNAINTIPPQEPELPEEEEERSRTEIIPTRFKKGITLD